MNADIVAHLHHVTEEDLVLHLVEETVHQITIEKDHLDIALAPVVQFALHPKSQPHQQQN